MARLVTCAIADLLDILPNDERQEFEEALAGSISPVLVSAWAIGQGHRKVSIPAVNAHRSGQCECRRTKGPT